MEITAALVKKLRDETGAGMMDAKKFLQEADGDFDKAIELFRKDGQRVAAKKADRGTNEGLIDAYIHQGGKVGVLLEVNCETDFVAKNEDFKAVVHDLAMHIAAFDPKYNKSEDVPAEVLDKEKEIYTEQLKKEGKPEEVIEKILDGKVNKFYSEVCLMNQPFLKNEDQTVEEYMQEQISKIGENIKVNKFVRYSL